MILFHVMTALLLQADSDEDEEDHGMDDDDDDDDEDSDPYPDLSINETNLKVRVLPLYSLLPTWQQMQVFEPAAEGAPGSGSGERLIVVSTNVGTHDCVSARGSESVIVPWY